MGVSIHSPHVHTTIAYKDLTLQSEVFCILPPWGSPKTGQLGSPQNRPVETVI